MTGRTSAEIMAGLPEAARKRVERILWGMPPDWRVGECTASAATGGTDWIVRLVDGQGQVCATIVVYCSEEEIAAGKDGSGGLPAQ